MILILVWSVKHCTNKNSAACQCAMPYLHNAYEFVYISFCSIHSAEENPLSSCFLQSQWCLLTPVGQISDLAQRFFLKEQAILWQTVSKRMLEGRSRSLGLPNDQVGIKSTQSNIKPSSLFQKIMLLSHWLVHEALMIDLYINKENEPSFSLVEFSKMASKTVLSKMNQLPSTSAWGI